MDSNVKQRLVGALILVALGVVFWPIIFVPGPEPAEEIAITVPPEPPIDITPVPEPDDFGLRQSASAETPPGEDIDVFFPEPEEGSAPAPLPQQSDVVSVPEPAEAREQLETPALDADGLPIAFSLQVATMSNRERAERLRDELVAAGYKGYLKRLRRDDKLLYRVLVGPRFNRDDLLPIKAAVDASWGVESLIMRYLP